MRLALVRGWPAASLLRRERGLPRFFKHKAYRSGREHTFEPHSAQRHLRHQATNS